MARTLFLNLAMGLLIAVLSAVAPFLLGMVLLYVIRSVGVGLIVTHKALFWWSVGIGGVLSVLSVGAICIAVFKWKLGAENEVSEFWTKREKPLKLWSVLACLLPIFVIFGVGVLLIVLMHDKIITAVQDLLVSTTAFPELDEMGRYCTLGAIIMTVEAFLLGLFGYFCMMCYAYKDISCDNCHAVGRIGFYCTSSDTTTHYEYKDKTYRERVGTASTDSGTVDVYGDVTYVEQEEVKTTTNQYDGTCSFCGHRNHRTKVSQERKKM